MGVRAKFKCESVLHVPGAGSVVLRPVQNGVSSDENAQFWKYTPSGSIELTTINSLALEQFIPGKEYYVDFTPADGGNS